MTQVNVEAKIHVYEIDDEDTPFDVYLGINSHWNDPDLVVIVTPAHTYTVSAKALRDAITAATVSR